MHRYWMGRWSRSRCNEYGSVAWSVNALHRSYCGSHLHHGVEKTFSFHCVRTIQMYDR